MTRQRATASASRVAAVVRSFVRNASWPWSVRVCAAARAVSGGAGSIPCSIPRPVRAQREATTKGPLRVAATGRFLVGTLVPVARLQILVRLRLLAELLRLRLGGRARPGGAQVLFELVARAGDNLAQA